MPDTACQNIGHPWHLRSCRNVETDEWVKNYYEADSWKKKYYWRFRVFHLMLKYWQQAIQDRRAILNACCPGLWYQVCISGHSLLIRVTSGYRGDISKWAECITPTRTIKLSQLTVNHCWHGHSWWCPSGHQSDCTKRICPILNHICRHNITEKSDFALTFREAFSQIFINPIRCEMVAIYSTKHMEWVHSNEFNRVYCFCAIVEDRFIHHVIILKREIILF